MQTNFHVIDLPNHPDPRNGLARLGNSLYPANWAGHLLRKDMAYCHFSFYSTFLFPVADIIAELLTILYQIRGAFNMPIPQLHRTSHSFKTSPWILHAQLFDLARVKSKKKLIPALTCRAPCQGIGG